MTAHFTHGSLFFNFSMTDKCKNTAYLFRGIPYLVNYLHKFKILKKSCGKSVYYPQDLSFYSSVATLSSVTGASETVSSFFGAAFGT